MLALGLSAARSRLADLPATLEDVRFHADLTMGDQPAVVRADWRGRGIDRQYKNIEVGVGGGSMGVAQKGGFAGGIPKQWMGGVL